ncbi:MAG: 1,2-phenylacetyl-CoA epoxidase subunit PaaD [Crocinitomicaceae bacterium]
MVTTATEETLWEWMTEVPDPEIPVINLVELGVIRELNIGETQLEVVITPTYTGCPAKQLFEDLISDKLIEKGISDFKIVTRIHPAWTTEWMSNETKEKLLKDGISPPTMGDKDIPCPQCKSINTKLTSQFGSTPCQSMYQCTECLESFNYFKCF